MPRLICGFCCGFCFFSSGRADNNQSIVEVFAQSYHSVGLALTHSPRVDWTGPGEVCPTKICRNRMMDIVFELDAAGQLYLERWVSLLSDAFCHSPVEAAGDVQTKPEKCTTRRPLGGICNWPTEWSGLVRKYRCGESSHPEDSRRGLSAVDDLVEVFKPRRTGYLG